MPEFWKTLQTEPWIQAFLSLYIVMNPGSAASVFMSLTKDADRPTRYGIALRATITAYIVLAIFLFAGYDLFPVLKIKPWAMRIAGGIIMFGFAFSLLRGKEAEFFRGTQVKTGDRASNSVAYYPLAIPLLANPGSITVVLTMSGGSAEGLSRGPLLLVLGVICAVAFLNMLRLGLQLEKKGPGLALVLPRFWGLLLAMISVGFIVDGIKELMPELAEAWQATSPTSAGS